MKWRYIALSFFVFFFFYHFYSVFFLSLYRGDLAERMPLSEVAIEGDLKPLPGEVVSIDRYGFIVKSTKAESRYVVGVVSTKPAHVLRGMVKESVPVALSGIVPCKVTDENGTILPGDLLVASSKPGYAMKAPEDVMPGTIIGKAMDSQEERDDIIPILMMLR